MAEVIQWEEERLVSLPNVLYLKVFVEYFLSKWPRDLNWLSQGLQSWGKGLYWLPAGLGPTKTAVFFTTQLRPDPGTPPVKPNIQRVSLRDRTAVVEDGVKLVLDVENSIWSRQNTKWKTIMVTSKNCDQYALSEPVFEKAEKKLEEVVDEVYSFVDNNIGCKTLLAKRFHLQGEKFQIFELLEKLLWNLQINLIKEYKRVIEDGYFYERFVAAASLEENEEFQELKKVRPFIERDRKIEEFLGEIGYLDGRHYR